jgi:hypothetical protein
MGVMASLIYNFNMGIEKELNIYLEKIEKCSVKESWVRKNLPNLYEFFLDKLGDSFSERVFIHNHDKVFCKVCNNPTKFLSYNRGYRIYCSKKCSNSDSELCEKKIKVYEKTCLDKWGC